MELRGEEGFDLSLLFLHFPVRFSSFPFLRLRWSSSESNYRGSIISAILWECGVSYPNRFTPFCHIYTAIKTDRTTTSFFTVFCTGFGVWVPRPQVHDALGAWYPYRYIKTCAKCFYMKTVFHGFENIGSMGGVCLSKARTFSTRLFVKIQEATIVSEK